MKTKLICFLCLLCLITGFVLPQGTQDAVVVGISVFRDLPEEKWLDYAHTDARAFSDLLKDRFVNVPPENLTTLLNEEATTVNLRSALGRLVKQATEDDIVYVYIASHGAVDRDLEEAFFVTYDSDPDNLYGTAYPMTEFQLICRRMKVKHLVVISDACKSGSIGAEVGSRRDIGEDEVVVNEFIRDILSENTEVGESQFIYAAAGARESSIEGSEFGGGVFTKYLIQGMKGAADESQDGRVTASELHSYVYNNVRSLTNGRQNPIIINDARYDGNLVLSILDGGASAPTATLVNALAPALTRDSPPVEGSPQIVRPESPPPLQETPRPTGFGNLILESQQSEVQIQIDGAPALTLQGQPLIVTLPAGSHEIVAIKPDYVTLRQQITVTANQQLTHQIELRPLFDPAFKELETKLFSARGDAIVSDPEQAQQLLSEVLETLVTWSRERTLSEVEKSHLEDSFIHLGNLLLNQDKREEFDSALIQLLEPLAMLPPSSEFDDAEKYLEWTGAQTARVVVSSELPDAILQIGDLVEQAIGDGKQFLLRPGSYRIRINKPNYVPFEATIDFQAGVDFVPIRYEAHLEKLHILAVGSQNMTVLLEGGQGRTTMLASEIGDLPTAARNALAELLRTNRIAPARATVALFRGLDPHRQSLRLEFSSPGFDSRELQVALLPDQMRHVHERGGYLILDQVVRLEQTIGYLTVQSSTPEAVVLLNRREQGKTPLEIEVPIGDYQLKVKHPVAGSYTADITIEKDGRYAIDAILKPVMVWVGVLPSTEVDESKLDAVAARLTPKIDELLETYLIDKQPAARYEYWDQLLELVIDGVEDEEVTKVRPNLDRIAERFDANLLLFGTFRSENEYLAQQLHLYLINTSNPRQDVWQINSRSLEDLPEIGAALDEAHRIEQHFQRNWVGLKVLDTLVSGHELVVLSVTPGSPAEASGLKKGDSIATVDGKKVKALELYDQVARKKPGDTLSVTTSGSTHSLTVGQIPSVLENQSLNNSVLFALGSLKDRTPAKSLEHELPLLNIAISHIYYRNWTQAIENLNLLDPAATVIPAGFVSYVLGQCFEALGEHQLAEERYREAQQHPDQIVLGFEYFDSPSKLAAWRLERLRWKS